MSRRDDDTLGDRLWAAETAPLPRMSEFQTPARPPARPDGGSARAVVMRLEKPEDVARLFKPSATVFVLMPDPPREGTAIECVLVRPGDRREAKVMAEVVRVGETLAGTGVELRFESPGPGLREQLMNFVRGR